jgi:hypothetical protein
MLTQKPTNCTFCTTHGASTSVHLSNRGTSYQYTLSYIRSLSPSSPSYQAAAIDAITTALRLPSVLEFDALFKLDAVVAVKDHELFSLLQVFLNEGLLEFYTWEQNHPSVLETFSEFHFPDCTLDSASGLNMRPIFRSGPGPIGAENATFNFGIARIQTPRTRPLVHRNSDRFTNRAVTSRTLGHRW